MAIDLKRAQEQLIREGEIKLVLAGYLYRLLIDPHLNAQVGLQQMTKKLVPVFVVFSSILILVIWL